MNVVRAIAVNDPGTYIVAQTHIYYGQHLPLYLRVNHRRHHLNAAVEIPWHPVGRADEGQILPSGFEHKYTRVFEITVYDAVSADILANTLLARYQRTAATHQQSTGTPACDAS